MAEKQTIGASEKVEVSKARGWATGHEDEVGVLVRRKRTRKTRTSSRE